MVDTTDYHAPVHRSLLQRELIAGIPQIGFLLLFVLGFILVFGLELYFMIIPIVLVYFVMLILTKRDPWSIDIFLENITQKDRFIP